MELKVVKVVQEGAGHYVHRLSDDRYYILETRGAGATNYGAWSLWKRLEGRPQTGKFVRSGPSLRKLLKGLERSPPR